MAVFVELTTDAFENNITSTTTRRKGGVTKTTATRRPLRGLEIKEETHAYIKLVTAAGDAIPLLDAGSNGGTTQEYSNFILQQVSEQRMERHQIVETFGDTYLFLFGESPRFLTVNAVLINSNDFNWKAEFMENYDKYLRGTKAIERGARTYLFYDENIVEGYILNAQVSETSINPMEVPLSFQFFVTNSQNISVLGATDPNFPVRSSAIIPGGLDPTNPEDTYFFNFFSGDSASSADSNPPGRTLPLRGLIADNSDEYLSGTPVKEFSDLLADLDVENIDTSLGDVMDAYGVDPAYSYGPLSSKELGYGPGFSANAFASASASASAVASFGASAGVSAQANAVVGGFAGVKAGFNARASAAASFSAFAGVSASAGAFAGARASAFAGTSSTYPGAQLGAGSAPAPTGLGAFFGASASARAGFSASAGASASASAGYSASAGASATAQAQARYGSPPSSTARANGTATAFASAKTSVRSANGYSYAQASARASAQAGGYAGANGYLGASASASAGASFAGNSGAGAAVTVTGKPSAFSTTSAPGTLKNSNVPPSTALAQNPKPWVWSKRKQWPSE